MSTPAFERTTKSFRIHTRDDSLWVEDINGGQDDAWLLVPLGELDALIRALNDARTALAPSSSEDTPAHPRVSPGVSELFCRDCGHPNSPWDNDNLWMCDRHRPLSEVPAGGQP